MPRTIGEIIVAIWPWTRASDRAEDDAVTVNVGSGTLYVAPASTPVSPGDYEDIGYSEDGWTISSAVEDHRRSELQRIYARREHLQRMRERVVSRWPCPCSCHEPNLTDLQRELIRCDPAALRTTEGCLPIQYYRLESEAATVFTYECGADRSVLDDDLLDEPYFWSQSLDIVDAVRNLAGAFDEAFDRPLRAVTDTIYSFISSSSSTDGPSGAWLDEPEPGAWLDNEEVLDRPLMLQVNSADRPQESSEYDGGPGVTLEDLHLSERIDRAVEAIDDVLGERHAEHDIG
jgi:hypothetical protein